MRLRVTTTVGAIIAKAIFQFLLVRLRVFYICFHTFIVFYISIPSGAIKRDDTEYWDAVKNSFQFLLVRLRVGIGANHNALRLYEFQFLLVRLRDRRRYPHHFRFRISIPSGAIKRICESWYKELKTLFQFLLVRLRVIKVVC